MAERETIALLKQIVENTSSKYSQQIIISGKTTKIKTSFNPPIELEKTQKYEMALVNLEAYYTFPNIHKSNNLFRYSHDNGTNWTNIHIPEGCYEIQDLNHVIQQQMKMHHHYDETNDIYPITISPNGNTLHSEMEIQDRYQVDFTKDKCLCKLLGFEKKVYTKGYHMSELPVDILSVNSIFVNLDIIAGSNVNGSQASTIYSFFPAAPPGHKILENPKNLVYLPITLDKISNMTCILTDQDCIELDMRGETVTIRFHLRQV